MILKHTWGDFIALLFLWQENIFYSVPPFATGHYRHSVESHVVKYEVNMHSCDKRQIDSFSHLVHLI